MANITQLGYRNRKRAGIKEIYEKVDEVIVYHNNEHGTSYDRPKLNQGRIGLADLMETWNDFCVASNAAGTTTATNVSSQAFSRLALGHWVTDVNGVIDELETAFSSSSSSSSSESSEGYSSSSSSS